MGIFFNREKKNKLVLFFDIGSSSVRGALFEVKKSGIPEILFSTREPVVFEEKINTERFLFFTLKSLEVVANRICLAGFGRPSEIFCILSSPWYASQTRIIKLEKNTPFLFSPGFAQELIEREISLFEKESLEKFSHAGGKIRLIEVKNMKTELNGYSLLDPFGKKAKKLQMTVFISISEEKILKKFETAIFRHFHTEEVKFCSFSMASFTTARDVFPNYENFILVNVCGEITDISIVKKNMLSNSVSYPLGYNFIVRKVAETLGCALNEAESFVSLYNDGHAQKSFEDKLGPVMKELQKKWLIGFQESLVSVCEDISVPANIFITVSGNLADFFSRTIKSEEFYQYTLTESEFNIIVLNSKTLHGFAAFRDGVFRDPFIVIESVFINRLICYNEDMSKNLLQDMIKVKPSSTRSALETGDMPADIKSVDKVPKYRIYIIALVSVIFLLFALSFLFSEIKVTLTPKVLEVPLQESLSASADGKNSDLSFDLVIISGEESKTIEGLSLQNVAVASTGTAVIYNSFSSATQTLDVETRLEGSNGKIYKTDKKVVVPGKTADGKPGSVKVGIHGAETGVSYNSSPIDFKIFGFKGTPKYEKFYARSEGDITGGFEGVSPVMSSLDKKIAIDNMKSALEKRLLEKMAGQIPSGFVFLKDAALLSVEDDDVNFSVAGTEDNLASASIKGSLYGFIFDEKKLTKKIAQDIIDGYNGEDIYIPNIRDLTFSFSDKDGVALPDVKSIRFSLSGAPKVVWKVDKSKFTADLLGKKKKDFDQIIRKYPSIGGAELVLRPFWKSSFPEEQDDLEVVLNYPQ